ncbi:MAG: hypothetical protein Q9227_000550 [Pyrenula ochraceoflavens]
MRKKDPIDVVFLNNQTPAVPSYTTLETISGYVAVQMDKDTSFTTLGITFEGRKETLVEKNETIAQAHLELPPSVGDKMVSSNIAGALADDMCPEMAKIFYRIRVCIERERMPGDRRVIESIAEKAVPVRIIPAKTNPSPEHPGEQNSLVEKEVKKGTFRVGVIGRIKTKVCDPQSLQLRHPRSTNPEPINTSTTIYLRFDPTSADLLPPSLESCQTKLKVSTYYASEAFKGFPTKNELDVW